MFTIVAFLPGNIIRPESKESNNNKKIRVIERKREERERERERAIKYYCSTVTSKISKIVLFTNHVLSAYVLHKAKRRK